MKRIYLMKRIVLSLLIVLGVFTGATAQKANMDARKLQLALFAISNLYVDSTSETKLVEDAIVGMLDKLDPHSNYMDPEETKEMTEPLQGNFDGIGIQFNMLTDTLYVIQVIPGGPSEKVGLMAGDRIIQVDDTLIAGVKMKITDIMKKLRGPKGTEVRVKVKRGKSPELMDFKIVRGKIPVYSLDAAYMADKNTGYIKLNRFAASSADEFREALEKLRKQGMKNLILDLQGNGGGYLNIAIELADEFLDKNRLIVYTKGSKQPREEANSTARGQFQEGRLVVLVDESSASASEIVAGALQDLDRAVLIGQRSFGKGLVQSPRPLGYNAMLKLTTAKYYIPSGRCIQAIDYSHSQEGSVRAVPDSLISEFTTRAGRKVYDGGGVMPDIATDPEYISRFALTLYALGFIEDFVDEYMQEHHTDTIDNRTFSITDADYDAFVKFMEGKEVPYESETRRVLKVLKEAAENDLYSDLAQEITAIEGDLKDDTQTNLHTYRKEIAETINNDIVLRHSYQAGVIEHNLGDDTEVLRATEVLENPTEYQEITTVQTSEKK